MPERKNKVGEESPHSKPKKPPGYRKFEKLLKQVVGAPPLKKQKHATNRVIEDIRIVDLSN